MAKANFTQSMKCGAEELEELKKHLSYNRETGEFHRIGQLKGRAKKNGVAGYRDRRGYIEIEVGKNRYWAHRLAWFFEFGEMPSGVIDHINRNPSDNRIENLRAVSQKDNLHNKALKSKTSESGWVGIDKLVNGYRVEIETDGKRYRFGVFDTIQEAKASYVTAKSILHSGFIGDGLPA